MTDQQKKVGTGAVVTLLRFIFLYWVKNIYGKTRLKNRRDFHEREL